MAWFCVHYLPLSVFILLPGTFLITYVISIVLGHVEVEFPYISDTGTRVPESCIFSQLLNIVSFLTALTIYFRYKQIEQYYRDTLTLESSKVLNRNWISFCIGLLSCFGLSIVANFQETSVFIVHMCGAMLCFGCGVIYCSMQTWLSFRMIPLVNSLRVARIRLFLCCVMFCTFLTSSICGPYAFSLLEKGKDPINWHRHDGGYVFHVISSVAEWTTAMSLDFFILTFVREMHKISVFSPRVVILFESLNINTGDASLFYQSDDQVEVVRSDRAKQRSLSHRIDTSQSTTQPGANGSQVIIH